MIIFGRKAESVLLEHAPPRYCPTCERQRPFSVWLHYQYDHLYFAFGLLSWRKYFLLCDVCRRGERLDRREYERQLKRVPIPFMHRFGCLLFPFVVRGIIVLAVVVSSVLATR